MGVIFHEEETMKSKKSTMKKRGQVTIPKSIREQLGLQENDQLEMTIEEGRIVIQPVITIAKDQAWFWSQEWQKGELEAEDDILNGRVKSFTKSEDAIAHLRSKEE